MERSDEASEWGTFRTFLGFLLAPAIVPFIFILTRVWDARELAPIRQWPAFFVLFGTFTYLATAVLGGPMYLLFREMGWKRLWSYAVGGAAIGLLVFVLLEMFVYAWLADMSLGVICVLSGISAASLFWLVSIWAPE